MTIYSYNFHGYFYSYDTVHLCELYRYWPFPWAWRQRWPFSYLWRLIQEGRTAHPSSSSLSGLQWRHFRSSLLFKSNIYFYQSEAQCVEKCKRMEQFTVTRNGTNSKQPSECHLGTELGTRSFIRLFWFWASWIRAGSNSQRYGSGSFYHRAKIVRKTLIRTAFWFFIFEKDVNVPSKSNKQKNFFSNLVFCWHLEGQWRK